MERLFKEACGSMNSIPELIGKALLNQKLTKTQAASLLRHRKGHSAGHMLLMIKLMIEEHLTFAEAHKRAMLLVGR